MLGNTGYPLQVMPMDTVLVVDDEKEIREVVCFALQEEGFNVVEAGDGIEGLARIYLLSGGRRHCERYARCSDHRDA